MSAFDALQIANTSLGVHQTWLDALANNIANANTVVATDEDAFQAQYVIAESRPDGGTDVAGVEFSDPAGRLVYDPEHPLADEAGYVKVPDMDLSDQMTSLIIAQRGYQAQVQVTKQAQEVYTSALQIGR